MDRNKRKWIALILIFSFVLLPFEKIFAEVPDEGMTGNVELIQEGALVRTAYDDSSQKLMSLQDNVRDVIYNGLISMDETIDLSDYNIPYETFKEILQDIVNSSAELFYVGSGFRYSTLGNGNIASYAPVYKNTEAEVRVMRTEFYDAADRVMAGVNSLWSDREKALYVHDYLVSQYEYDSTLEKFDAYSLLVDGTAVCQGYTLAYIYFMKQLGIPCVAVPSDEMGHIWNQIELDGNWYHVDMTYDDPVPDLMGAARHNNFLLSDTMIAIQENNQHSGWESDYECTDTTYDSSDYFWKKSNAPFVNDGDNWYFIDSSQESGGVYTWEPDGDSIEQKVDLRSERWYTSATNYYVKKYTGIAVHDKNIYFNTQKQIRYFSAEEPETVINVPIPDIDGSIFGLRVKNNVLEYAVGTAANALTGTKAAIVFETPELTYPPVTTPEPTAAGASESPSASPKGTDEPEMSPTVTPEMTGEPKVTGEPEMTGEPEGISPAAPEVSNEPKVTNPPFSTVAPQNTGGQQGTALPQVTENPSGAENPTDSVAPEKTTTPAQTVKPEETKKTAVKIVVSAKKGKRKITVQAPKKSKVVISLNKRWIIKKKKKYKKMTITPAKNKSGKVVIRLSNKLKKKVKITVTVTVAGTKHTKKIKLK